MRRLYLMAIWLVLALGYLSHNGAAQFRFNYRGGMFSEWGVFSKINEKLINQA